MEQIKTGLFTWKCSTRRMPQRSRKIWSRQPTSFMACLH